MYQSFYKLTGKPFRLSPDPSFFFPSRGHKRALAYLRYGLNQDEGFVVITGAPGTGKTTLAKILLHEMGEKEVVVAHLTTTQLEADDMLRMVTASFGLRYEGLDKAQLLKTLESFLLARSRENKRALLVIDEAQNLPARSLEELRMLSNLQVGDKALVQTFLLGQAQFRTLLDKPELEQLRQRIIANYHLSPLAADESQRYIESRLQQVGWASDPKFAEIAYEKIHEYTEGIPRRINMLCDRVLLYSCMEEIHEITGEVIAVVTSELDNEISGSPVSMESSRNASKMIAKSNAARDANKKVSQQQNKPPFDDTNLVASLNKMQALDNLQDVEQTILLKTETIQSEEFNKYKKKKEAEDQQQASKKSKTKNNQDESSQQVEGNTVTQTDLEQPLTHSADDRSTSEIPERDLFRVIPGGKPQVFEPPLAPANANPGKSTLAPAAKSQPTAEDVIQRRILRLVLAFHRSPSRFPGLDNPSQPLPEGITELLELAISDDEVLTQVSPAAVMGISPAMLRAAVRFFVRRALFVVDGDDYRVLGLQPTASQPEVEKHYDLLMRLLRQDKQRGSADSVARVGQAYENLSRLDQASHYGGKTSGAATTNNSAMANSNVANRAIPNSVAGKEPKASAIVNVNKPRISTSQQSLASTPTGSKPTTPFSGKPPSGKPQSLNDLPVDETIAFRLNKTGKLKLEQGPEFEIEDGEMTIDFDSVTRQAKFPPLEPIYSRKPNELFSKETKFSRKSMRFAGQFAVLGFGAIVIILGLYIVQLEPTADSTKDEDVIVKKLDLDDPQNVTAAEDSRSSALQLADGSAAASAVEEQQPKPAPAVESKQSEPVALSAAKRPKADTSSATYASIDDSARSKPTSEPVPEPVKQPRQVATYADLDSSDDLATTPKSAASTMASRNMASQDTMATQNTASASKPGTSQTFSGKDIEAVEESTASYADLSESASTDGNSAVDTQRSLSSGESVAGAVAAVTVPAAIAQSAAQAAAQSELTSTLSSAANEAQLGSSSTTPMDDEQLSYDATTAGQQPLNTTTANATVAGQNIASANAIAQISEETLSALMSAFIKAYESADLNKILNLFAPNARTNKRTTLAGIKTDYEALFGSTSLRQMSFNSLRWDREGDHARGVGDYLARINPNGTPDSQSFAGNVTIQVNQVGDTVKITRFYFSNQKVSSGPRLPEAGQTLAAVKPALVVSIAPSIEELNIVIGDFVKAYDQGDIDGLMATFAPNARTNDQSTFAGIRKDHVDLFKNTSVRQMSIDNMNWTFENDVANGIAKFVVLVQGINSPSIDTFKGTIRVSAKKSSNGVKITQLLHNIQ